MKHIPEHSITNSLKFKITLGKQNHIYKLDNHLSKKRIPLHMNFTLEGRS